MLWFTHIIFALFLSLIYVKNIPQLSPELFIIFVCIGSILPDIDAPKSFVNRKLKVTKLLTHIFQHRGFFHSIFPVIIIYALFASAGWHTIATALSLGYLSHLAIDAFTVKGINIIHPIPGLRISGFMDVGSITEWIIFSALVIGTIAMIV